MEYSTVVRNATRSATTWAASPVGLLVRVEVLVTVSCALLATLVFLGSGRRTSRSAAFRFIVWMALMLCYPAVSYTIGLIQSGAFRNDLVVVWACFLIGCADGIFACSVDHSDQQARTVLNQATQVVYVLLLLVSYVSDLDLHLKVLLLLLWLLNVAKLGMRLWSLLSAGRDRILTADNWLISKYMAHDQVTSIWDFEPKSMQGYEYVVTGERDVEEGCAEYKLEVPDDHLITVDKLWQHDGALISKGKLKDLCLSFALFKLLRRRLCGNPLHEREDVRTLVFIRRGLAGGDEEDDYERMYRVVEVELGFLFDFFYTRYPQPKQSLIPETAIFISSVSLSLATLLSPALLHYNNRSMANSGFVTTALDIWLARFVIALFVILELFQYMSLVLSDWHKVKMMCRYVRRCTPAASSWWPVPERLPLLLCRVTLTRSYWSNSVGQYSLLHACLEDERSWLARVPMHRWIKDQLSRIRTVTRPNLPLSVKRAIHHFLRTEWLSDLKYGDRTLQRHAMMHDLDWCTSRYRHGAVGSILVWHIATTIYQRLSSSQQEEKQQQEKQLQEKQPQNKQQLDGNREVAITLSNYCAYLLFQAPELVTDQMTDQIYERRRLTEALKLRVHQFIKRKGCRSKNDMFHKLAKFQSREVAAEAGGYEEDILDDGIKLGYQIFEEMPGEEAARWKVLSEMWVELMLSIAPSDNAMVHVKKLATGGELITHVWALMTHAGIIHRPEKPCYDS